MGPHIEFGFWVCFELRFSGSGRVWAKTLCRFTILFLAIMPRVENGLRF